MCIHYYIDILYKSFLIDTEATAEDVIAIALDKANLSVEYEPHCYTVWDRDIDQTSRSSEYQSIYGNSSPISMHNNTMLLLLTG